MQNNFGKIAAQWAAVLVLIVVTGMSSAAVGRWLPPKTTLENACGALKEMGLKRQAPAHPHNLPQAQQSEQLQEDGGEDETSHSSALLPTSTLSHFLHSTFLSSSAAVAVGSHSINAPKLFILHHSLVV